MRQPSPHPSGDPSGADQPPKTLVEGAYLQLRRDIVAGTLAPGSKLRVEHLKDHYQVGAGTLREALALLVADTLVVTQGQRGFRVAPISAADLQDITQTRILLETEALKQSIRLGDAVWESELIAAFHLLSRAEERLGKKGGTSFEEWEERNRLFHEKLIAACPSRWIHHFLSILYQQSARYRRLSMAQGAVSRDVHEEHRAIYEAALDRDLSGAAKQLTGHIQLTYDIVTHLPQPAFMPTDATPTPARKRRAPHRPTAIRS